MKEAKADLSDKTIINLVGPSAVGKTTIIKEIDEHYSNFSKVVSYTTREPRKGEPLDTYRFINAHQADINELKENSIQFDQFPGTNVIYGTQAQDYRNRYNLLDTLSSSVDSFRDLGIAACKQFIIIAKPNEWQARIDQRKFNTQQLASRYDEALKSLSWSVNEGEAVKWIDNKEDSIGRIANLIVSLSINEDSYQAYQDRAAKEIGQALLSYIKYLKKKLE